MSDKHDQSVADKEPLTAEAVAASTAKTSKKPWQAPKIISQEPLEAVAAVCGPSGAFGKASKPLCGTLGS